MSTWTRITTMARRAIPNLALLRRSRRACALLLLAALGPARAFADPVLGFIDEFSGTSTGAWSGGSAFLNPGTGGYLGAGDGYLEIYNTFPTALGTRASGSDYAGNWTAAGVTQIRVWLNHIGVSNVLEIHLSIGDGTSNFWQYNVGLVPPHDRWAEYVVDLTSGANWTQTEGSGTFAAALTNVDRVHLRHDPPPFAHVPMQPDPVADTLGIDHVLLTNGVVGVDGLPPSVTHPVELAPPYPNPSRGPVSFVVRAADGGPIQIRIVDVSGRAVRSATLADAGSGPRTWLWDGRDAAGRVVPAGTYRVRATGTSGGTSRPLVRVN